METIECCNCKLNEIIKNDKLKRFCNKHYCYACTMYEAFYNLDKFNKINIENYQNNKFEFECICCNDENIKMDIDALNDYITNVTQYETIYEYNDDIKDFICDSKNCKSKKQNVSHCIECQISFCKNCINNHQYDKHTILNKYTKDNLRYYQKNKCEKHQEDKSMYCYSCQSYICCSCQTTHQTHSIEKCR